MPSSGCLSRRDPERLTDGARSKVPKAAIARFGSSWLLHACARSKPKQLVDRHTYDRIRAHAQSQDLRQPKDVWRRASLPVVALMHIAAADGFKGLGLSRREAIWAIKDLHDEPHVIDLTLDLRRVSGIDGAFPVTGGRGDDAKRGGGGEDSRDSKTITRPREMYEPDFQMAWTWLYSSRPGRRSSNGCSDFANYVKRVENTRELRLTLMPFLADRAQIAKAVSI